MRGKELNELKIVSTILQNGKLKSTGTSGDSVSEKFKAAGLDAENNSNVPVSTKTIKRYLSELCGDGILIQDDKGYYSINESYFMTERTLNGDDWKRLLNDLLENNELEIYRQIRNTLSGKADNGIFDNVELKKYSEIIKESVHILTNNQSVVKKINYALEEDLLIRVAYKGKEYTVYPVCYVVSRDGTRKYLYILRKGRLQPMELTELKFLEYQGKQNIEKAPFVERIQNAWDINVEPPCKVKVMVHKNLEDSHIVMQGLQTALGNPVENRKDYNIYEGDIIGINDFKAWVRRYVETCIILQPDDVREQFITALQEKSKRYGE